MPSRERFQLTGYSGHLAALVLGAIFPLGFAPFDAWPVSLISLMLLPVLLHGQALLSAVARQYLFAVGMYGTGVSWVYVSIHEHGGAPPILAALLVLLFVLSLSSIAAVQGYVYARYLRYSYLSEVLGFTCLWVLQEWVRTWLLTGFPWLLAGYTAMETPLVHVAPVGGVLAVSFAIVISASLGYGILCKPHLPANSRIPVISGVVLVLVWIVALTLSIVTWVSPREHQTYTASLVQGNIDQKTKWLPRMREPILEHYWQLSRDHWSADLIVWPEAALTIFKHEAEPLLERMDRQAKRTGTTLITGLPTIDEASGSYRNSAISLGNGQGLYDKVKLVPFGEYVPFESLLRGLIEFFDLPMSRNNPGEINQAPLTAGDLKLSLSICYEVVFPEFVRRHAGQADLLITISNDTWFGRSIGPLQHLQMARMRAVENSRYMLRATNNGVTAIIDDQGVVVDRLPQFEAGVLHGEVKLFDGETPFSRWGSLPVLLLCGLILVCLVLRVTVPRAAPV